MGMMNLAGADSAFYAFQLGLFFFFAFGLPELYHAWVWEQRPCDLLRLKLARCLLNTAGLTTLSIIAALICNFFVAVALFHAFFIFTQACILLESCPPSRWRSTLPAKRHIFMLYSITSDASNKYACVNLKSRIQGREGAVVFVSGVGAVSCR